MTVCVAKRPSDKLLKRRERGRLAVMSGGIKQGDTIFATPFTNRGICCWYEFTTGILKLAAITTPVVPITSDQYPQKARRPRYSVPDNSHLRLLGMDDMEPW